MRAVSRDDAQQMCAARVERSRQAIGRLGDIPSNHPVWSERYYKVYLYTPDEIRGRIGYIERNSGGEGLASQVWSFVKAYDGWPWAAKRQAPAGDSP